MYERAEMRAILENAKTSTQDAAAAGTRMLQLDKRLDIGECSATTDAALEVIRRCTTDPNAVQEVLKMAVAGNVDICVAQPGSLAAEAVLAVAAAATETPPPSPQSPPSPGKGEGEEPTDARVHQVSAVGEPASAIDEFLSLSKRDKKVVMHHAHQDEKRERERKKREQRKVKRALQQANHVLASKKDEEKNKVGKEQEKREAARRAFEEKQRKRAAEAAALAAKEAERERLFADLRRDANGNFLPTEQFTNKLLPTEGGSCEDKLFAQTVLARQAELLARHAQRTAEAPARPASPACAARGARASPVRGARAGSQAGQVADVAV